jgi:RNA binding exosome subunit
VDTTNSVDRKSALGALTWTNILLAFLCAAFAGGFLYFEFGGAPDMDEDRAAQYAEEAQQRLQKHADEIRAEATSLAKETVPPIADAVYAQVQEDYPKYLRALENQGDEYIDNVEQILVDKVRGHYRDFLAAHRKVLEEEFPKHADPKNIDRVMQEFENRFQKLAERYYLDEFRQEAERTKSLWAKFEPLPIPGPNEPSLEEQLADYTADWTAMAVAADNRPEANSTTRR